MKGFNTAEEALLQLQSSGVTVESVTNILASDIFTSDMMVTCKGVS